MSDRRPDGSRKVNLSPKAGSPPLASEPSRIRIARTAIVPDTIRKGVLAGKKVNTACDWVCSVDKQTFQPF